MSQANISGDLIWEIVRNRNAYLIKGRSADGAQFSRDPFNLVNKHSRSHAGFVNNKAVSVQANGDKGVTLTTKKSNGINKPATAHNTHSYSAASSNRKISKSIADSVGKRSYRGDLNKDAVARASAIRQSQRTKKDAPASKPRGAAAKKIASA